jgi:hypothetical protein
MTGSRVAGFADWNFPPPLGGGGSGWGRIGLGQRRGDCLHDSSTILQHVVVPERQNSPSLRLEIGVPLRIVTVGVSSAVSVDSEFRLEAGEIHDVWRDRMLSPETAPEPIVTKLSASVMAEADVDCALSAKVRASPPP